MQTSIGSDFQSFEIISNALNAGVYMLEIKEENHVIRKVLLKD